MLTRSIPSTGNQEHIADDLLAGLGRLPDLRERQQIRDLWNARHSQSDQVLHPLIQLPVRLAFVRQPFTTLLVMAS